MEAGLADLGALIAAVRRSGAVPARLYLVARTTHLAERWCDRVPQLELAGDAGSAGLGDAARDAATSLGIDLVWESPAEVIPLPVGWEERSRPAAIEPGAGSALEIRHFDPYSVVLRLIARGDEPDYLAALEYVRHGWVEPARLEGLLGEVVPRLTSQTLAQDPAEFRRKFKGLRQLYLRSHAVYSPGGTRAGEAVASA
ncbi:MAG: hypothetical protein Q8Q85_14575 [Gemmatimonadales bacterium]|nr:hypothetical protein [Gemmatimonadales bacterium]